MTALGDRLIARILRTGPLSVAEFMTECLLNPRDGYYTTHAPFGTSGDFTTAPEISQMFGELLGLWLAQVWLDQGRPARFVLAELGPGRGTMMADILRATARIDGFHDAMHLALVEASPALRQLQKAALSGHEPGFCDHVGALPPGPLYLLANEFFDALPIRQFQRGKRGWHERQIGTDGSRLVWGLAPERDIAALDDRLEATPHGHLVELNAPALPFAGEIGQRIARDGGAALIVDYGGWESHGDTFQAVSRHGFADPLNAPGTADLTAHVAFGPLARAATPARATDLMPQGVFLERLGITPRAEHLAAGLTGPPRDQHIAAHRRLTHPDEMGTLFKVMGLRPPDAPPLPALEPAAPDVPGHDTP
ncbi:class I SAM-dependent methyltransferase [Rhodophyticola sp. CCM32]|uniref:class I SAM-dependent methyltransferase n=1 Tax=Rhodophyticola sp. CCM32 TaxID=2916397 RepID=UPI00107F8E5A|nr:SAM-dependent methyltransferase [Rhodophyticola sp. CCM32]QBX99369.1 class I SAM-dependent methyltransferase [Rhodophyticola sp. CCM32]